MKKNLLLFSALLAGACSLASATPFELTFTRTGTTANDVAVNVNGIDGVTASLTGSSHALRATAGSITESIICPDVNANTNPTITLTFAINGLPEGMMLNYVDLHIHGLNGANGYQQPNDRKNRHWNVNTSLDVTAFASYTDLDPAAGIDGAHKVWTSVADADFTTGATDAETTLTITITKGTDNQGCFFGLSSITLGDITPEEPAIMVDDNELAEGPINLEGDKTIYLQLPEGVNAYYRFTAATPSEPEITPDDNGVEAQAEHTPAEGFTQYVHENGITLNNPGTLELYAENHGRTSATRSISVTGAGTTSISEIGVCPQSGNAIYDLQGRRVSKAERGLYIINGVKTMIR